jgi:hypothetical protein
LAQQKDAKPQVREKENSMSNQLAKELHAAKELRQSLIAAFGEDAELIRDTIEGETNLREAIAGVADSIREDETLTSGLEAMIDKLAERKQRIESRIATKRAIVLQAMSIGEIKTLELPDVTLTVKAIPRAVEIIDEAQIPAEFWKAREPTLDRKGIAAAIKEGRAIPGATLDNGGVTLQLRRQ